MIDHSIYEVYQQDKKVVIPDFGAFIFSDVTESIDFNDLLTFDNGKVIAEIQKQQKLPEEEARYALSEYVQQIKDTLSQGNLHFFEGIGYLAKDAQGFYSIQETMSSTNLINEEEIQEPAVLDINENSAKETLEEEPNTLQENAFSYSPIYSGEDENVQQYYKRKDKLFNHDDKRSPLKIAMWIVLPLIVMVPAVFYYFNYYNTRNAEDHNDWQQSQISTGAPAKNYVEQVREIPGSDDDKNEIISRPKNMDASQSGQENKQIDSPSAIDTRSSGIAAIGQSKIYSLILGSFREEDNADKFLLRLQEKGMEVEKFQRSNNFYSIGIEHIEGKSHAVKLLAESKKEEPTAWIINNQ